MLTDIKVLNAHRGGMAENLGIEFTECSPSRLVAVLPVTDKCRQPLGYLHGGASLALAETVASVGAWCRLAQNGNELTPDTYVLGQEINANHLRSVRDGKVRAVGAPLHVGRTSQVWEVKIYDDADRLICVSRCTLAVVRQRSITLS